MATLSKFNTLYNYLTSDYLFDAQKFEKQFNLYPVNSAERIRMILDIPYDGCYTINGKRFCKSGNSFLCNDKQINARQLNDILGSSFKSPENNIEKTKIQIEKSGFEVEIGEQPNILIVKGAYTLNGQLKDDVLSINQDGSIINILTNQTYNNIKEYLDI